MMGESNYGFTVAGTAGTAFRSVALTAVAFAAGFAAGLAVFSACFTGFAATDVLGFAAVATLGDCAKAAPAVRDTAITTAFNTVFIFISRVNGHVAHVAKNERKRRQDDSAGHELLAVSIASIGNKNLFDFGQRSATPGVTRAAYDA